MAIVEEYRGRVSLLVKVLPLVAAEKDFALKGGTAINLFHRDMPRLSVDIDLTYLPVADRAISLTAIDAALKRIASSIKRDIWQSAVNALKSSEGFVTKLILQADGSQIKIEVTPVLRGCVYEPVEMSVSPRTEEEFGYAEMQVVSFADLYAGKIVAALDRQHPRDLFDVRDLLATEGVTDELRRAFIVYLLSHNRPMAELLAPARLDITEEFERGFRGMTTTPVTMAELTEARERLIETIVGEMPQEHRRFLISFKEGEPDWPLLGIDVARQLPAVRWRAENLAKLPAPRRKALIDRLLVALNIASDTK